MTRLGPSLVAFAVFLPLVLFACDDTSSTAVSAGDGGTTDDDGGAGSTCVGAGCTALTAPDAGLGGDDGGTTTDATPAGCVPTNGAAFALSVSSGDLRPAFSPDVHDYELTSFTTLAPVSVTVCGRDATVDGHVVANGTSYVLPSPSIAPTAQMSVAFAGAGDAGTYTVHFAPADLPAYSVMVDNPDNGHVFLSPTSWTLPLQPYLMVVGTNGALEYYNRIGAAASDFKKQTLATGAVRYTYIAGGTAFVLDEKFQPLTAHQLSATLTHLTLPCDQHDFVLIDDDHYVAMALVNETVENVPDSLPHPATGALVRAAVVQEVKAGRVVFEWDSTSHPELYALSTDGNDFTSTTAYADYAHMNSIEIDPSDGELVLSFRHLDAILKVRHQDGSIAWRLGGPDDSFGTTAEQKTSHQHFARFLPDGRLQVFDNGNATQATRIVTYGLDQTDHEIESFESVPLDTYTMAMGSVERLGSSLFLGLGAHQDGAPDVIELDPATGHHAFELHFTAAYYSYRAIYAP